MSIVWKKTLLELSLYFSVQIETRNYKLIYESQFRHFIEWGKILMVHSMTNSELQLWGHKIFQLLLTSVLEWRVVKTVPTIFDYVFTFWDIGLYYIFVSFEIDTESWKSFIRQKLHIFKETTGSTLLCSYFFKYTFLLQENTKIIICICWYCNFNLPTRSNDIRYLRNVWYFSQIEFLQIERTHFG